MELNRKQIVQIALGSRAFEESLKDIESGIPANIRMKVSVNANSVKPHFEFIESEEESIYKSNYGIKIGNIGWFYKEDKAQVDSFNRDKDKFLAELQGNLDEKKFEDIEKTIRKEFPTTEKSKKNEENAFNEWKEFIENETNTFDCSIASISVDDFNGIDSNLFSSAFVNNYVAAGVIK